MHPPGRDSIAVPDTTGSSSLSENQTDSDADNLEAEHVAFVTDSHIAVDVDQKPCCWLCDVLCCFKIKGQPKRLASTYEKNNML